MIIKQGEFVSFAPAELHERIPMRAPAAPHRVESTPTKPEVNQPKPDLLRELERLVRENERLTLERDQLREELSRQSLEVRRSQQAKRTQQVTETAVENLRRQALAAETPRAALEESEASAESEDAGYKLARVVVNWFWEDADEASVRLVHDALAGQGIRTLLRDDDEGDA